MTSGAKSKNFVFWMGLVLCTVYQSYRYPLQINTVGFSPNYSDTPLGWQLGKFLLAFPLLLVSALRWVSNSARVIRWPTVITAVFLSIYCSLKILGHPDPQYIDVSFWLVFSLVLVLGVDQVTISQIERYLYVLLIYSFASNLIEVLLYLIFGRLPAMAGGFVRFGGFLDDPNGFAPIVFLLMGWCYLKYEGRKRAAILAALFVCLVLTQSWTAFAFLLAVMSLFLLIAASKRPMLALFLICVLPWSIVVVVQWIQQLPLGLIRDVLEAKQGSIEGHFFPWEQWGPRLSEWAILGDSQYNAYECWWAAAMVNFGLVWLVAYLGLITSLLLYTWRSLKRGPREARAVYAGLLFFGAYFAAGSMGLPFPIKFPVNVLFFLLFFLVAFGKISIERRPTHTLAATHHLAKAAGE
jgi:hypothetical protein